MKIFFVRHQAGGLMHEAPFLNEPTAEQIASVVRLATARHGERHPKTGEPYWARVEERRVLNEGELLPLPEPRAASGAAVARIGEPPIELSGTGSVQNPE